MCDYCGCRANSVIALFTREHEQIINALGTVRRSLGGPQQSPALEALASLLDPHTTAEERSLFAELGRDAEFSAHIAALCAEHRDIEDLLERVRADDHAAFPLLEELLRRHIDKEENGLFPASIISLDGAAWARAAESAGLT